MTSREYFQGWFDDRKAARREVGLPAEHTSEAVEAALAIEANGVAPDNAFLMVCALLNAPLEVSSIRGRVRTYAKVLLGPASPGRAALIEKLENFHACQALYYLRAWASVVDAPREGR